MENIISHNIDPKREATSKSYQKRKKKRERKKDKATTNERVYNDLDFN